MNRPPPPSQTRLLSRFRSAFFATPGCALLTLLSLAVLWLMAESLTRWLIIDAVFGGEDREACASGGGMCWPFVAAKIELWIYGRYPAAERWRADMAFALLAFVLLQVATARHKTAAAVLAALLPVAPFYYAAAFSVCRSCNKLCGEFDFPQYGQRRICRWRVLLAGKSGRTMPAVRLLPCGFEEFVRGKHRLLYC